MKLRVFKERYTGNKSHFISLAAVDQYPIAWTNPVKVNPSELKATHEQLKQALFKSLNISYL